MMGRGWTICWTTVILANCLASSGCITIRDSATTSYETVSPDEFAEQIEFEQPSALAAPVVAIERRTEGTAFASLIRAPGQRVAINDPEPILQPRESPKPADIEDEKVPTVPVDLPNPGHAILADPVLVSALREAVKGSPERMRKQLHELPADQRELVGELLLVAAKLSQDGSKKSGPKELGELTHRLQAVTDNLAERSPLGLENLQFCQQVKNFGRYEPLPESHLFRPGSLAQLYAEVKNVPSVPVADGQAAYVTRLVCTLQVRDDEGEVVELTDRELRRVPVLTETKKDYTRNRIRDYFLLFRFAVPKQPGLYLVTVEVQDPETGRAVSRSITVRVR